MGEKVNVDRAEVTELLGLPADVDDATLNAAIDAAVAQQRAREAAAARNDEEQQLVAEDRRLVAAAISDGRLHETSRQRWVSALAADRAGNRLLLASLAPGIRPDGSIGGGPGESEQVFHRVMGAFGFKEAPRSVAAASQPPAPPGGVGTSVPDRRAYSGVNAVSAPIPEDAVVTGRPPWEWSSEELESAALWNLGPGFRAGLKPPPAYGWSVPPVPGSASDLENSWRGTSYYQGGE